MLVSCCQNLDGKNEKRCVNVRRTNSNKENDEAVNIELKAKMCEEDQQISRKVPNHIDVPYMHQTQILKRKSKKISLDWSISTATGVQQHEGKQLCRKLVQSAQDMIYGRKKSRRLVIFPCYLLVVTKLNTTILSKLARKTAPPPETQKFKGFL